MSDRLPQLKKLYDADPSDPFITYGIAMELIKTDQHSDAIEWFDKTLELDAGYCYAYFQKGKSLAALGQHDQARQVIEAGIHKAQEAKDEKAVSELSTLLEAMR